MIAERFISILLLLIALIWGALESGCKRPTQLGFSQSGEDGGTDTGDSTDDTSTQTSTDDTDTTDAGDDSGIRVSPSQGSNNGSIPILN